VTSILPGSTVGVLGGGQLGRMLGMAARRLGYRFHVLASNADTPAGQVADHVVIASYDDAAGIREFARGVDVLTFEFENIATEAATAAAEVTRVRPDPRALAVAQHRIREKTFLMEAGLPVPPFVPIGSETELSSGIQRIGRPAVLKTAAFGYDGKGQVAIGPADDPVRAWEALGRRDAILEAFVDLEREMSVGRAATTARMPSSRPSRIRISATSSMSPSHPPASATLSRNVRSASRARCSTRSTMSASSAWSFSFAATSCSSTRSLRGRTTRGI
jgi:phosphoribosylaminoimidazole carboxylase (NCAIR synthetase)